MFKLFNSKKANAPFASPVHKQGDSPAHAHEASPSDIGEASPMDGSEVSPVENVDNCPTETVETSSVNKIYVSPTDLSDAPGEEKSKLNRTNTARRTSHKRSLTALTFGASPATAVGKNEKTVFFTHNWGEQHANHKLCSEINAFLKTQGIATWFDEERMSGQILDAMVNGLDNAACLLIAVTKTYIEKINGSNNLDNCKKEFDYAMNSITLSNKFVCIITDEQVIAPGSTLLRQGRFRMAVDTPLYIMLYPSITGEERKRNLEKLVNQLKEMIHGSSAPNLTLSQQPLTVPSITAEIENLAKGPLDGLSTNDKMLTQLFKYVNISKPKEYVVLLIEHNSDSLDTLALLDKDDFEKMGITSRGDITILHKVLGPKYAQKETYDMDFSSAVDAGEVKVVLQLTLMARNANESAAGLRAMTALSTSKKHLEALIAQSAPEVAMFALKRFGGGDAVVAADGSNAIAHLAVDTNTQVTLTRLGAGEMVMSFLSLFDLNFSPEVAINACDALWKLAQSNTGNHERLGELGACGAIVPLIKKFGAQHTRLALYGCAAVCELAELDKNQERFGDKSTLKVLASIAKLTGGGDRLEATQWSCAALWKIAAHPANHQLFVAADTLDVSVACLMRTGVRNQEMCLAACIAIERLHLSGVSIKDSHLWLCVEATAFALKHFGQEHLAIAEHGLGAFCAFTNATVDNYTAAEVDAIVRTFLSFCKESETVALCGYKLISLLTASEAESCRTIDKVALCKPLVLALDKFGTRNEQLAVAGCKVITDLAPRRRQALIKEIAGNTLVGLMEHYAMQNADVVSESCNAIAALRTRNAKNAALLREGNVCVGVTAALNQLGQENPRVAQAACNAIGTLAEINSNLSPLHEAGACVAIIGTLRKYGSIDAPVATAACFAIFHLAKHGANCETLSNAGVWEVIPLAMQHFGPKNPKLAEFACASLADIASATHDQELMRSSDAFKEVIHMLKVLGRSNVGVASAACFAIMKFAQDDENRVILRSLRVIPTIKDCKGNNYKQHALAAFI